MPKEIFGHGYPFLPKSDLLTFEEIIRLVRIFVRMGVRKVRLTGGEPLLRQDIEQLIEMLAQIPNLELALTTNGALLARKAQALKDAGLHRITISLDSLDDEVFRSMNDVDFPVDQVLEGLQAAERVGFHPIKINMVVIQGVNDHTVLDMARRFHRTPHIVRFIEFMDVGSTNGWRLEDVVPAAEIIRKIHTELPLEPINPNYPGEVAKRWRYQDGGGEIGVIASVTKPFCKDCTRVRLSARGQLYTCLFATHSHDLRQAIRNGYTDDKILSQIARIWTTRSDRYSEIRTAHASSGNKAEMFYIGG